MLDKFSINVFVNVHKNYSYPTTTYESILIQMHVFLVLFSLQFVVFTMKYFKQKLIKIFFSSRHSYILVKTLTCIYRRIAGIFVYVIVCFFSKIHPACHNDVKFLKWTVITFKRITPVDAIQLWKIEKPVDGLSYIRWKIDEF